jgi:hypothetical protein
MNQFFSLKRFTLLVLKHWADNRKRYVLSVLAFTGLLIVWFVFMLLAEKDSLIFNDPQYITYFFPLFIVGTFFASSYFSDLGSKAKGANFLLIPASAFEKLLCSLLFVMILFFIVLTSVFYLIDMLAVSFYNNFLLTSGTSTKAEMINVFDVNFLKVNPDTSINFLIFFLIIQSAFLLGSVYFEKYSFIKTIIAGFVAWFILFCVMYLFYSQLLPGGHYPEGFFTSYRVYVDGSNDHLVQIPEWMGIVIRFFVIYATAPFLWIVTYYRLKEKQV